MSNIVIACLLLKNNPVVDWDSLSTESNIKMSKECSKMPVMHNIVNCEKSQPSGQWIRLKNLNCECLAQLDSVMNLCHVDHEPVHNSVPIDNCTNLIVDNGNSEKIISTRWTDIDIWSYEREHLCDN